MPDNQVAHRHGSTSQLQSVSVSGFRLLGEIPAGAIITWLEALLVNWKFKQVRTYFLW